MRKQLFEAQEECAKRKKSMQECVTKQQQTETEEQGAKRKKTMQECVTKQRQTETEEQGAKRKKTILMQGNIWSVQRRPEPPIPMLFPSHFSSFPVISFLPSDFFSP